MKSTILPLLTLTLPLAANSSPTFALEAFFNSKYIEQGYSTTSDPFYTTSLTSEWNNFSAFLFYGKSPEVDFEETSLGLHYTYNLNETFSLTTGYIRYDYGDGSQANELDSTLSFTGLTDLDLFATLIYNLDSKGIYLETGAVYGLEVAENLSITTFALIGIDFGYTTDDNYDGTNHFQIGVDAEYSLPYDLSVIGSINQSIALADLKRNRQDDESWVSLGLIKSF